MDRFQYLLVMGVCLLGTLPLEWVFRARVYRRPIRLLRTLSLPVLVFCSWDAVAIARGHWTFSERYTTGWRLPFDIPIEELTFFVVIPICALLTLESVRFVLRQRSDGTSRDRGAQRAAREAPATSRTEAEAASEASARSRPRDNA